MINRLTLLASLVVAAPAFAGDKSDTPLGKAYTALLVPMEIAKIVGEECGAITFDHAKAAGDTEAFIDGQMDAGVDPSDLAAISDYVSRDDLRAAFGAWIKTNNVAHGDTPALCAAGRKDAAVAQYLGGT